MRRWIGPVLFAAALVTAVFSWWIYSRTEGQRFADSRAVLHSFSDIRLSMVMTHTGGPLAEERYTLEDRNGVSTASYRASGRRGVAVTVASQPYETFDVSFLFGKLVQDGLWELQTKPLRGDISTVYRVAVFEATEGKRGSHAFTFSDPRYWATAREFNLHLERGKPLPDLLVLRGRAAEPRYQTIVDDFRAFGTPSFRQQVALAAARAGRAS